MSNERSAETKRLIIATFSRRLLSGTPYETLTVREIAKAAAVARSTVYAHFRTKSELLRASLSTPFTPLANCVSGTVSEEELQNVLSHFWDNRVLGRSLFYGSNRRFVSRTLADMVAVRLKRHAALAARQRAVVAVMIAEAQIGTVAAWLTGDLVATVAQLASALGKSSRMFL